MIVVKDQGGVPVTASRAYRHAFAVELNEVRTGRFTPSTGDGQIPAVTARPSRAKGKARRKKGNRK